MRTAILAALLGCATASLLAGQLRITADTGKRCYGARIGQQSVLTAAHCVGRAKSVRVGTPALWIRAESWTLNPHGHDLAIVRTSSPLPSKWTISKLSPLMQTGRRTVQARYVVRKGRSGSPVFDREGRLVATLVMGFVIPRKAGFADADPAWLDSVLD